MDDVTLVICLTKEETSRLITSCWDNRNDYDEMASEAKGAVKKIHAEQAEWWNAMAEKLDEARGQGRPCLECGWQGDFEGSIDVIPIEKDAPYTRFGWLCDEHADMDTSGGVNRRCIRCEHKKKQHIDGECQYADYGFGQCDCHGWKE